MRRSPTPFAPECKAPIDLARSIRHQWVESVASHDDASASQFLGTSITSRSISLVFLCIITVTLLFGGRAAHLQLWQGRGFAIASAAQREKLVTIPARRGIVTDQHGVLLVTNLPRFVLEISPAELPRGQAEREQTLARASLFALRSEDELQRAVISHRYSDPLIIRDDIPYPEALKVMVATESLPGVAVSLQYTRAYHHEGALSLSHILGYLGRISEEEYHAHAGARRLNDMVGRDGLELFYDDIVRGSDGKKHIEIDALGREKRIIFEERPHDGSSLQLTIDAALQKKSEEILRQWMERFRTARGVVILSDPMSGRIRALVNLPSYDNNLFAKGISTASYQALLSDPNHPLFNRALRGEYPSGSTLKPFIAAAALKHGIVTEQTTVHSSGGIRIGRWFFPDWKEGGHGTTNLSKALAESVNTYFYLVGGGSETVEGLGIERIANALRMFGFGSPTGIDLRGEEDGFIPSQSWKEEVKGEQWYIGDTYHVAIGQGDVLVTPLQIHTANSYFAQSGTAYQPMLVEAVIDQSGERHERIPRVRTTGVLEPDHIKSVRDGMRRAVTQGSARRLSMLSVSAAGKTGTAQWSSTKNPHAWFTGWAPYENPTIMITVLVEEGEEGSKSAIGVAHDILQWYFSKHPEHPVDNEQ